MQVACVTYREADYTNYKVHASGCQMVPQLLKLVKSRALSVITGGGARTQSCSAASRVESPWHVLRCTFEAVEEQQQKFGRIINVLEHTDVVEEAVDVDSPAHVSCALLHE